MGVRTWRPDQDDFLRRNYRSFSLSVLAAVVCKPESHVVARLGRLGCRKTSRRRWRPWEVDFLRLAYPDHTAKEISAVLGRGVSSIYVKADELGMMEAVRYGERLDQAIREHHPKGWSDAEIAAVVGCKRKTVSGRRTKLGLPANDRSEHYRDRVRQKTREQLDRAGLKSLADLQKKVWRERAIAAGWPADLRFRQVQILNVLWDRGPMTRLEIAKAIGARTQYEEGSGGQRKILSGNDPEGSYLANLIARGLVLRFRKKAQTGERKRRRDGRWFVKTVDVYMLAFDVERGPVLKAHEPSSGDAA